MRYRDIEQELQRVWEETHTYGRFPDALQRLVETGRTFSDMPSNQKRMALTREEFLECAGDSLVSTQQFVDSYEDRESTIIPAGQDLFAFKVMRHSARNVHPHGCFDIDYVYRGSGVIDYDGVRNELSEGDLCLVAPGASYTFECDDDDDQVVLLTVYVRRRVMERTFFDSMSGLGIISDFVKSELYSKTTASYLLFRANETNRLNEIVQNIFIESNYPDALSNEAAACWLRLLFVTLLRDFDLGQAWQGVDGSTVAFHEVLAYIHTHIAAVNLRSVADHFGYNKTYFSSLFHEKCHQSFRDYVSGVRMARAKELLSTTNLTMERVASSVGYGSADHFQRKFKRTFGITPGQFRRLRQ